MQTVTLNRYNKDETLDKGCEVDLKELAAVLNAFSDALVKTMFWVSRSKKDAVMVDVVDHAVIHISSDRLVYSGWIAKMFSPSYITLSANPRQAIDVLTYYLNEPRKGLEAALKNHFVSSSLSKPEPLRFSTAQSNE